MKHWLNLWNTEPPKMFLSSFCVGHLMLGMGLTLKTGLFPSALGLHLVGTLVGPMHGTTVSCEFVYVRFVVSRRPWFLHVFLLWPIYSFCLLLDILWALRRGVWWWNPIYSWVFQGHLLSENCLVMSPCVCSHLLQKTASLMMAKTH